MDPIRWQLVPVSRAERTLIDLVEAVGGHADARIGRHCPRCGSAGHGRPFVVGGGPSVSLARADGHALIAVGYGPLGVDLERPGAVSADAVTAADLPTDADPTVTWVWAEALGKAHGDGLAKAGPRHREVAVVALDLGPRWVAALAASATHLTGNWSPAQGTS